MLRVYKILNLSSILIILIFLSFSYDVFAQQYCIYQRDYMQHLCKIPGAQRACYAPDYNGKFPDYSSCENARRSTLPSDTYWQRITRCIPCGPAPQPSYQQKQSQDEQEKTAYLVIDKLTETASFYTNELFKKYGETASKEFHEKWATFFNSRVVGKHVSQITPSLLEELHQIYNEVNSKYNEKKRI